MDQLCRSCFQPLTIHKCGYFSIYNDSDEKLTEVLLKLYFEEISPSHFKKSYETKAELKEYLSFINTEIGDTSKITGSIHHMEQPSQFEIYSFNTLYEHTFHEKYVHLIKNGNFTSFLQPIVKMKNDELFGYESLLRSKDQSFYPSQLFEIARKTEMHSILDKKAREVAIKARTNKIPTGIKSFINFLPSTIYNPEHCLKHTFKIVEKYNVDPNDLVFEVVETEKIHDVDHLKSILDTYRNHGMKVALDDVGAGYSTLDMLSKLQPDYIKIDRQYIQDCHINKENQVFLQKVLYLSTQLNIVVLAEGIELKEEYEYLKSIDVTLAQGYYIGKPSPNPVLLPETLC
ncbi:EAL domain-containing protein (putative c-di-GMP-specific phosphodiesterase class I) [Metabacillus crassostreae]|uniref:EAL domain-containing protein n=1 Tax=Metabacillus crassostreae TaxID=929098 RepID=UPI001EF7C6A7|nr:EAL domain-containing protein [Metabacillus crassostreae]MBM7603624.1 EAL domain-containing protein (putative c-di-GMP-specific phosphodiesterase class I) [Metabacillus crassostreae]